MSSDFENDTPPPERMGIGSEGPAVSLVVEFLIKWSDKVGLSTYHIDNRKKYNDVVAERMDDYQRSYKLPITGELDLVTIQHMKTQGFDFIASASAMPQEDGITTFRCRVCKSPLFWAPGVDADEDKDVVLAELQVA